MNEALGRPVFEFGSGRDRITVGVSPMGYLVTTDWSYLTENQVTLEEPITAPAIVRDEALSTVDSEYEYLSYVLQLHPSLKDHNFIYHSIGGPAMDLKKMSKKQFEKVNERIVQYDSEEDEKDVLKFIRSPMGQNVSSCSVYSDTFNLFNFFRRVPKIRCFKPSAIEISIKIADEVEIKLEDLARGKHILVYLCNQEDDEWASIVDRLCQIMNIKRIGIFCYADCWREQSRCKAIVSRIIDDYLWGKKSKRVSPVQQIAIGTSGVKGDILEWVDEIRGSEHNCSVFVDGDKCPRPETEFFPAGKFKNLELCDLQDAFSLPYYISQRTRIEATRGGWRSMDLFRESARSFCSRTGSK
jgi:hypothetical protein